MPPATLNGVDEPLTIRIFGLMVKLGAAVTDTLDTVVVEQAPLLPVTVYEVVVMGDTLMLVDDTPVFQV